MTIRYIRKPPPTSLAEFVAFKSREEHMAARRNGIGTSDIGGVAGVSSFKSILEVYGHKRIDPEAGQPTLPDKEQTEEMYWGTVHEPSIRRRYVERTGAKVFYRDNSFFKQKGNCFIASVDGLVPKENKILEIKTAGFKLQNNKSAFYNWGEEGGDDVPLPYIAGVQWSMGVLGPEWQEADIAALFSGNKLQIYTVKRSDKLIAKLQKKALEFWKCVCDGAPPQASDGSEVTRKALESLYKEETVEIRDADIEAQEIIEMLDFEIDISKAYKKRIDEKKNRLRQLIGINSGIQFKGITWTWKEGADGTRRLLRHEEKEGE